MCFDGFAAATDDFPPARSLRPFSVAAVSSSYRHDGKISLFAADRTPNAISSANLRPYHSKNNATGKTQFPCA
jgi:hypothetical protein